MESDLTEPFLSSDSNSSRDYHDRSEETLQRHHDETIGNNQQQPPLTRSDIDNNANELLTTPLNDDINVSNPWKNHNVILSFALCIFSGIAESIWTSVVLSGFLIALATSMGQAKEGNTLVGGAEAAQGLTQLITALPVGYLADTWGKSKTVRLGGILMVGTIGLTLVALVDVKRHAEKSTSAATRSYILIVIALALWGIIAGISNGPSQALFSDSVPKGKRSELLTWLYSCYMLSSTVGPIVSIAMILTVSADAEVWSINEIYPVFLVGVILEIPAAIIMLFFNDKHSVIEVDEHEIQTTPVSNDEEIYSSQLDYDVANSECVTLICSADVGNPQENGLAGGAEVTSTTSTAPDNNDNNQHELDPQSTTIPPTTNRSNNRKAIIPYVLFTSSLISSLGSGASVKYFPLFFKEVGFGSAAVQGIFLVVPISISCFSFIAQVAAKRIGRIETTVATTIFGVSLLLWMTHLSRYIGPSTFTSEPSSLWESDPHKALLIVIVYLFRTGIMNCSYPLLESILMDNVPSNQRARWKSLESIASFGWTGSALLGGILSDEHSYQFTFAMTAWMQFTSALVLLIIQPLVEKE